MNYTINEARPKEFKPVEVCITCETREELEVLHSKLRRTAKGLTYNFNLWRNLTQGISNQLK